MASFNYHQSVKCGMHKFVMCFAFAVLFCMQWGLVHAGPHFVIQHKISGKYVHQSSPRNNDPLHLGEGVNNNAIFEFILADDDYGYIRQVSSGKVWHPEDGKRRTQRSRTKIVLQSDRERHAQWALDQKNNHIVHRDGLIVGPKSKEEPYPDNGTPIALYKEYDNKGMEWLFLNAYNTSEELAVYGSPEISSEWELIWSVANPLAKQVRTITYTVGKSKTESTENKFEFKWEFETSFSFFVKFSNKISLTTELKQTRSSTWNEETTVTDTFTVEPGQPVAIWQLKFIGFQNGHKATFRSNIVRHTKGRFEKPSI